MFSIRTPGERVPKDYPLRRIKDLAEVALATLSPTFERMYRVGGLKKTRFRGTQRTQLAAYFVGAAYNLLRMTKLVAA
jgi:hypothetical protein